MHAYDFILILFSFVYAASVTHLLGTAGELIIASKRVRASWINAGWMVSALLFTCAWWIGLWDLHIVAVWDIGTIAFYFAIAAGIYLLARLVSPRVPEAGEFDQRAFHAEGGRKYLAVYALLLAVTVYVNATLGQGGTSVQWPAQNLVIAPMTIATAAAAVFPKRIWVQIIAVAAQILGWAWYFAVLQSPLS